MISASLNLLFFSVDEASNMRYERQNTGPESRLPPYRLNNLRQVIFSLSEPQFAPLLNGFKSVFSAYSTKLFNVETGHTFHYGL